MPTATGRAGVAAYWATGPSRRACIPTSDSAAAVQVQGQPIADASSGVPYKHTQIQANCTAKAVFVALNSCFLPWCGVVVAAVTRVVSSGYVNVQVNMLTKVSWSVNRPVAASCGAAGHLLGEGVRTAGELAGRCTDPIKHRRGRVAQLAKHRPSLQTMVSSQVKGRGQWPPSHPCASVAAIVM